MWMKLQKFLMLFYLRPLATEQNVIVSTRLSELPSLVERVQFCRRRFERIKLNGKGGDDICAWLLKKSPQCRLWLVCGARPTQK
jgi:hypothetical protein